MLKLKKNKLLLLFSLLCLLLFSFILIKITSVKTRNFNSRISPNTNTSSNTSSPQISLPQVEIKTFKINGGWGYDIFRDGPLYIHQTNIPAVSGNQFFETEEDALKIAELAKMKIIEMAKKGKNGLPTMTVEEIKEELK